MISFYCHDTPEKLCIATGLVNRVRERQSGLGCEVEVVTKGCYSRSIAAAKIGEGGVGSGGERV